VSRRRTRVAAWARRLAVLGAVAAAMAGGAVRGQEERPRAAIWFHPLPSAASPYGPRGGSRDFLALFQRHAAWPRAMAHVGVVGLYAGWIAEVSDPVLRH
jgi:hypothetical protein